MKKALAIASLSLMLAACSTLQPETAPLPQPAAAEAAAEPDASGLPPDHPAIGKAGAGPGRAVIEDPLPAAALTNEILFKLVAAEIAFQRGQWQTAYITALGVAQGTRDPRIARRATEIAMSASQPAEALAAVRLWRELAPHSEVAAQYYLGLVILSDNPAEAQPLLAQRLATASPQERNELINQIQRLLLRARDKAIAFDMLEQLLLPYADLPQTPLALAQGALAKGDRARAFREAGNALRAEPDSELAALTLAQMSVDQAATVAVLTQFLDSHPQAREVRMAYARILVEQKQFEPARRQFEILLNAQPQDLGAMYALGILGLQANDLDSAEKYLDAYVAVLEKTPREQRDPTQALMILAQIAEDRKDVPAALHWLEKIAPGELQSPTYFSALLKRAQLVAKQGDLPAAQKLLQGYAGDNLQQQAQIVLAQALILREAGLDRNAFSVLAAGRKRFPDNTELLYDYAMAAEKLQQHEQMEAALRRIIKQEPQKPHAYNALGYSLADRNLRLPEARALIARALELAPEDPFIMDSMGWVEFRLGKLKQAEALLRRSYALRPDVEIATHLGEVLWASGKKDEAQQLWRAALAKEPGNAALKSTLARLKVQL
ncbi:tetratricopeptide repeat protein [Herminiimonas sp. CN]|uniref:tetratricopeptide repeat protein n=1 Tax=Herminiimonas sp. CN TaxID=1349818 RepID=UPI0004731E4D|nr:tetratricopeptide repeat protein [Herminiimonas sp. CN]